MQGAPRVLHSNLDDGEICRNSKTTQKLSKYVKYVRWFRKNVDGRSFFLNRLLPLAKPLARSLRHKIWSLMRAVADQNLISYFLVR